MIAFANQIFTEEVVANLLQRPFVRSWDWVREHCYTREGYPYDADAFPHHEAVYDALDDPQYRYVVLKWATRLGKTFIGQSFAAKLADTNPRAMQFVSASETAAVDTVLYTLVPMLRNCPRLRDQVPERPNKHSINLRFCRVKVAWGGSPSRLADASIWYQHDSEVDKYTKEASFEADPLELALERVKEHPDFKVLIESTPGRGGHSRVDRWLTNSTNCRRWVPCPHCGEFQVLVRGGVVWDQNADGKDDSSLAFRTARYVCCHCKRAIRDHQKPQMLRLGVWAPEGQSVRGDGRLKGMPVRETNIWGCQLSSLYSRAVTFGAYAQKLVGSRDSPTEWQNFVNSWDGECYDPFLAKSEPEVVAERLQTEVKRGLLPDWVRFVVVAADVQGASGGYVVWGVVGFGPDALRAHVCDYGLADSLSDFERDVVKRYWLTADNRQLWPSLVGVDSGYDTKTVYDWCELASHYYPLKGTNSLGGKPYAIIPIVQMVRSKHQRSGAGGNRSSHMIRVPADYWEGEIQERLERRVRNGAGSLSLCATAERDADFIRELCNGALADKVDSRGEAKLLWVKRWPNEPNDCRDMIKYALCLGKGFLDNLGGHYPSSQ